MGLVMDPQGAFPKTYGKVLIFTLKYLTIFKVKVAERLKGENKLSSFSMPLWSSSFTQSSTRWLTSWIWAILSHVASLLANVASPIKRFRGLIWLHRIKMLYWPKRNWVGRSHHSQTPSKKLLWRWRQVHLRDHTLSSLRCLPHNFVRQAFLSRGHSLLTTK